MAAVGTPFHAHPISVPVLPSPACEAPAFCEAAGATLPCGAAPSSVPNSLPCSHCPDHSRGPISTAKNWPRCKICHLMVQDPALLASLAQGQRLNPTGQGWRLAPGWLFGEVAQPPSPHPWPSPCREWEGPGRLAAVLGRDAGPAPALQQCLGEALASVGSVGCRPHPSSSGASRPPQTKLETNEASGQWDWLRKKKYSDLRKIPVSVKCPSNGAAFLGWAVSPSEAGGWELSPCRCPLCE